jgi:hypothetical protein
MCIFFADVSTQNEEGVAARAVAGIGIRTKPTPNAASYGWS